MFLLSPAEYRYSSLAELAEETDRTKQALSRELMRFRQELKLGLNLDKAASTSEAYRAGQYRSIDEGRHYRSSHKRADTES
jgi:hypothetical protein